MPPKTDDPKADAVGPTLLHARRYQIDGALVLELDGECDLATRETFSVELAAALAQEHHTLVVDLTRVRFCEIHCAAQLVEAARRTRMVLAGAVSAVALPVSLLDANADLPRYPDLDAATETFSS